MNTFFASDWHLGETRLGDITKGEFNPFFRPFKNVEEQDNTIIDNINAVVDKDDLLYLIGDIAVTDEAVARLGDIKCRNMILIIGNYDEPRLELLKPYFQEMHEYKEIVFSPLDYDPASDAKSIRCMLNHYPTRENKDMFNIVGHIHGLWKVKRNMVNVSTDAWHFRPVSLREIQFVKNAIDKGFYDENVFYGEAKNES